MKTLPGAKGGPVARATEGETAGEEGYRATVVVCGKSVHIIRRNRKEEISVGTAGGGEGWVCGIGGTGWNGGGREGRWTGRYYLREATRTGVPRARV